jgi:hypothetical protein
MTKNCKNTIFLALFRLELRGENLIEAGNIIVFWNQQNINNNILNRKISVFNQSISQALRQPKPSDWTYLPKNC